MTAVDEWAQAVRESGGEGVDMSALGEIVEELLDKESSFAEHNAKRMNLVRQTFKKKQFEVTTRLVDILLSPIDILMNKLLQRTNILNALRFKTEKLAGVELATTTREGLERHAQARFEEWVSGELGRSAVKDFIVQLKRRELADLCLGVEDNSLHLAATCFQLVIFGASDIWRRLCFPVQTFPFVLFSLVHCANPTDFICKWTKFRSILKECIGCVDVGFSKPLLQSVDFAVLKPEEKANQVRDLQRMLRDVMVTCPLATDTVENLHGQHQHMFHRFRGRRPGHQAAAEQSILHSLQVEHYHIKEVVDARTLPPKYNIAQMIRKVGVRQKDFKAGKRLSFQNRLHKAVGIKVRKIPGWNVFQREKMQLGAQLNKDEYSRQVKNLSAEWRSMSPEEKQAYTLKAQYEQSCRDELAQRPLLRGPNSSQTTLPAERRAMISGAPVAATVQRLEQIAGVLSFQPMTRYYLFFVVLRCVLFGRDGPSV